MLLTKRCLVLTTVSCLPSPSSVPLARMPGIVQKCSPTIAAAHAVWQLTLLQSRVKIDRRALDTVHHMYDTTKGQKHSNKKDNEVLWKRSLHVSARPLSPFNPTFMAYFAPKYRLMPTVADIRHWQSAKLCC
ncbi:hypothetical protein PILCRDRAFT_813424 [Piloderma croceum F 1598]|uniref:Secreted protein n=1 Tax=Piloderma croceum (strain F 1598) TaxID=765440 RepID=A0A0C3BSI4_PILCF|nr:hypothetical protein PILCRDRAFT_813424 [Piloderma croceum F 1598]